MTLVIAARSSDDKIVIVADTAAYGSKSPNRPADGGLWTPVQKVHPIADGRIAIGLSGYFRGELSRTYGYFDRRVRDADNSLQSMTEHAYRAREEAYNSPVENRETPAYMFCMAAPRGCRIAFTQPNKPLRFWAKKAHAIGSGSELSEVGDRLTEYRSDMKTHELIDLLTDTLNEAKTITKDDKLPLNGTQVCVLSYKDRFKELQYSEKD
ncbi:MAG TPA: hypothetical protein VI968_03590 [archaeon]|nr:hypothetical protein [archaeon]